MTPLVMFHSSNSTFKREKIQSNSVIAYSGYTRILHTQCLVLTNVLPMFCIVCKQHNPLHSVMKKIVPQLINPSLLKLLPLQSKFLQHPQCYTINKTSTWAAHAQQLFLSIKLVHVQWTARYNTQSCVTMRQLIC